MSEIQAISQLKEEVGKKIKSSKIRYTWKFRIDTTDHTVIFADSRASGQKKITHNGKTIHEKKHILEGNFDYRFSIGYNMLGIQYIGEGFDLRINNKSFVDNYPTQATKNDQIQGRRRNRIGEEPIPKYLEQDDNYEEIQKSNYHSGEKKEGQKRINLPPKDSFNEYNNSYSNKQEQTQPSPIKPEKGDPFAFEDFSKFGQKRSNNPENDFGAFSGFNFVEPKKVSDSNWGEKSSAPPQQKADAFDYFNNLDSKPKGPAAAAPAVQQFKESQPRSVFDAFQKQPPVSYNKDFSVQSVAPPPTISAKKIAEPQNLLDFDDQTPANVSISTVASTNPVSSTANSLLDYGSPSIIPTNNSYPPSNTQITPNTNSFYNGTNSNISPNLYTNQNVNYTNKNYNQNGNSSNLTISGSEISRPNVNPVNNLAAPLKSEPPKTNFSHLDVLNNPNSIYGISSYGGNMGNTFVNSTQPHNPNAIYNNQGSYSNNMMGSGGMGGGGGSNLYPVQPTTQIPLSDIYSGGSQSSYSNMMYSNPSNLYGGNSGYPNNNCGSGFAPSTGLSNSSMMGGYPGNQPISGGMGYTGINQPNHPQNRGFVTNTSQPMNLTSNTSSSTFSQAPSQKPNTTVDSFDLL